MKCLSILLRLRQALAPRTILLVLPVFLTLPACIFVPIHLAAEKPFQDAWLASIEIGTTKKTEIATAVSDLDTGKGERKALAQGMPIKFRGGNWWLYARARKETEWFWMWVWPAPGGGTGDVGTIISRDYHFLLIKFDDNDVVAGYELSSLENDGCNQNGICKRGFYYMLLASPDEELAVKRFDTLANRCSVYLYGKPKFEVSVWLDGQQAGWLLDKKGFFFWPLDQGVHQLSTLGPHVSDQSPIQFDCVAGSSYFFETALKKKRSGFFGSSSWTEIEGRDEANGRRAIGKRRLLLSIAESSE